jgi:uncharacterized membrane protein YphA (DoxX/SURF4 family)
MSIGNRIAGPLLASIFVYAGSDAYRNPEGKVKSAERVTKELSSRIEAVPDDPAKLVKFNAAVQVGAGSLLAAGKVPRLAALALIGSIVPTTYAGHRFWDEVDDDRRAQQTVHFFKNVGILGGLVLVALEPPTTRRIKQRAAARRRFRRQTSEAARHVLNQVEETVANDVARLTTTAGSLASSGADLASSLASSDLVATMKSKAEGLAATAH